MKMSYARNLWCVLAVFFLSLAHAAPAAASCGTEFEPCEHPLALKMASLTIDERWHEGNSSGLEEFRQSGRSCEALPVSKTAVLQYFRRAGRISREDNHYIVSASPCRLSGELRTTTGRLVYWSIGNGHEGTLEWEGANKEYVSVYLYCGRCRPGLLDPGISAKQASDGK